MNLEQSNVPYVKPYLGRHRAEIARAHTSERDRWFSGSFLRQDSSLYPRTPCNMYGDKYFC